ncbi:MAG: transposase [Candidatus Saccharimonadales bacterium]
MPTRNVVKIYVPDSYYHIYNRGWNLTEIFLDEEDYSYFERILERHLSLKPRQDSRGREYAHFFPIIQLNAYCLMGNHFHMLVYQQNEHAIADLMKSILVAYTFYFNKKYKRRGALFESTYKAVLIREDIQLMHITRYIHLNHNSYQFWQHSSYQDYLSDEPREYINPRPILELFASRKQYEEFVADYEELQRERDTIKRELSAE